MRGFLDMECDERTDERTHERESIGLNGLSRETKNKQNSTNRLEDISQNVDFGPKRGKFGPKRAQNGRG